MLPNADRVAANYIVETTNVCEIGESALPGDESGVDCSFVAVGETSGTFPLEVSFEATTETRGVNAPLVYEWNFDGDGVYEVVTDTASVTHVFSSPGRHSVGLRVSSGEYSNTCEFVDVVSTTGDIYADGNAAVNGDGTAEHPFNRLEDALNFVDCTDHIRIRGEFIYNPAVSRIFATRGFIFEKWGDGPNPIVKMINGTKAQHMVGTFRINADDVLISGIDFHYNLEAQSAGPFFNVNGSNVTFRNCTFKQITWVRDGGGSYGAISVLDEGNSLENLTGLLIDGCTFEDINAGYTGSYPVIRPGKHTRVVDSTFTRCASIFVPSRIWWSGEEMSFVSNRVFDNLLESGVPAFTNHYDAAIKNTSFFTDNLSRGIPFATFDPKSPNFARPHCDWASDGWTDNGLYPSYIGAKPPMAPQGMVLFLRGPSGNDVPVGPEPDPDGNSMEVP